MLNRFALVATTLLTIYLYLLFREMNQQAEIISMWLTIPTLALGINVIRLFWRRSLSAFIHSLRTGKRPGSVDCIRMGITLGFAGGVLDNLYWLVAWSLSYVEAPKSIIDWFFFHGVWANIPFRQSTGILAAYLHCVADTKGETDDYPDDTMKQHSQLTRIVIISFIGGGVYALVLWLIKTFLM